MGLELLGRGMVNEWALNYLGTGMGLELPGYRNGLELLGAGMGLELLGRGMGK